MKVAKLLSSFLIVTLITSSSFAEQSVFLNKDEKAPYSGYLLPESKVIELRNNTLDMEYYKRAYEIKSKQVDMLIPQLDKSTQALNESKNTTNWERAGWFVLGILATGLAIKGVKELNK